MKNLSDNFMRDVNWFLSVRHIFTFDGGKPQKKIHFDVKGVSGIRAFHIFDSQGKLIPTKHPILFSNLLKIKAACNFHIKMYAEGRADATFPYPELISFCNEIKSPTWFLEAIENYKIKIYYDKLNSSIQKSS